MSDEQKPMTVGDLKKAIADLPDDMPLIAYDYMYCELFTPTSLPTVTEMVEVCFPPGSENEFMLAEEFETRKPNFRREPKLIRKFSALHM